MREEKTFFGKIICQIIVTIICNGKTCITMNAKGLLQAEGYDGRWKFKSSGEKGALKMLNI